ncbi:FtsX-like permease family protein [Azospirillum rugosum]|uniref:FtsX-like permease family protein n=1 Tax=Azospirillum rugosum TaxID=416170 RepID=UPI00366AEC02
MRDFAHEAAISACIVGALAAVLAPLLVLFGLKYGVIDTIARRLVEDPHNRELILVGSGMFTAHWIESLRDRPDVSFAMAETRRLSASFNRLENPATGAQASAVGMVPSGPGEPLIPSGSVPASDLELTLSSRTAQRLGVGAGDMVRAVIERLNNGGAEAVEWNGRVRAVVPEAALGGDSAFVTLPLLVAIEDFRDGMAVERFGWPGVPRGTGERVFPRFRLYARSIYDVAALRDSLFSQEVELRSRAEEVEVMQALDANLTRVFWTVAVLGSAGFAAALAASLVAGVERKRRDLSVLRLIGFPGRAIVAFPLCQALLIGMAGSLLAGVAYAGVAMGLNSYFAASLQMGEFVCRLLPEHFVTATAVTLACALAAASWAGIRAARIQPAEGLRDV